jgi:hypothetical protein
MNPLIQLKKTAPVFFVALVSFGLLPTTQTVSPAPHGTFTTFDPPGSTFTETSAITPGGVIIGSYVDASGVTHGFLRGHHGNLF